MIFLRLFSFLNKQQQKKKTGFFVYSGPGNCYFIFLYTLMQSPFVSVNNFGHTLSFYYFLINSRNIEATVEFKSTQSRINKLIRNRLYSSKIWTKAKYDLPIGRYKVKIHLKLFYFTFLIC